MVYRLKSRKRDDIDLVWITVYVVSAMYQEFIVDGVEAEKKNSFSFFDWFFHQGHPPHFPFANPVAEERERKVFADGCFAQLCIRIAIVC